MKKKHVFPWWAGYLLINPLRKLNLDPEKILGNYVKEGMTVIDAGCAMGFFSLPLARMVGDEGRVVCVDIQEKMLSRLKKRADSAGLDKRIITRECSPEWLRIDDFHGRADAAIAFGVVHETPDEGAFIAQLGRSVRPGGLLVIGEPKGPVNEAAFNETVRKAESSGFSIESFKETGSCRITFFRKHGTQDGTD